MRTDLYDARDIVTFETSGRHYHVGRLEYEEHETDRQQGQHDVVLVYVDGICAEDAEEDGENGGDSLSSVDRRYVRSNS